MKTYVVADIDGRIRRVLQAAHGGLVEPPDGAVGVDADPDLDVEEIALTMYLDGDQLRYREAYEHEVHELHVVSDGVATADIRVPVGATADMSVHGRVIVEDGLLQIAFTEPKVFAVEIDPFPFRTYTVTIHATDSGA